MARPKRNTGAVSSVWGKCRRIRVVWERPWPSDRRYDQRFADLLEESGLLNVEEYVFEVRIKRLDLGRRLLEENPYIPVRRGNAVGERRTT